MRNQGLNLFYIASAPANHVVPLQVTGADFVWASWALWMQVEEW